MHRATVERFGRKWTEPENIVTNGPYRLTGWKHDESITLTKWEQWRGADAVEIERFAGRIIKDATTALTAFEAGELDACLGRLAFRRATSSGSGTATPTSSRPVSGRGTSRSTSRRCRT